MLLCRVFVLIMVAIGVAWIPIVQNFSELFHYIQSVTSYLSPPICAVYVLAICWSGTNEKVILAYANMEYHNTRASVVEWLTLWTSMA